MTNVNNLLPLPTGTRLSRYWLMERAFSEMHLWDLCQGALLTAQGDDLSLHRGIEHRSFNAMLDMVLALLGQDEALGYRVWEQR